MREARRFLGLELSGAKSERTALAAIEFYPREGKIFLLDVYDRLSGSEDQSPDEALIELLNELRAPLPRGGETWLGVNVPLTLPPCLSCSSKTCRAPGKCSHPATRWMRTYSRKIGRGTGKKPARLRQITPYTQRPVELWLRHEIVAHLPEAARFEVDEALGGTKAPLTARMNFLQRCLPGFRFLETSPKLTTSVLSESLQLSRRTIASYRHLEAGSQARMQILEALTEEHEVFIYDRDLRKLSTSLAAFDAFLCAFTALLASTGRCRKPPAGFPVASGWVEFPA